MRKFQFNKTKNYIKEIFFASLIGGLFGGVPSVVYLHITHQDWLEPTRQIGLIFLDKSQPSFIIFIIAFIAHFIISFLWSFLLWFLLPEPKKVLWGALAGVIIALVDFKLIAPMLSIMSPLKFAPQVIDHIVWGSIVGFYFSKRK